MIGPIPNLHQQVMDILHQYDWPGNIRQLRNVVEYISVLSDGHEITIDHLPEFLQEFSRETNNKHSTRNTLLEQSTMNYHYFPDDPLEDKRRKDEEEEKEMIEQMLILHRGNLSAISREMKISRPTLYKKIKKLNLSVTKQYLID